MATQPTLERPSDYIAATLPVTQVARRAARRLTVFLVAADLLALALAVPVTLELQALTLGPPSTAPLLERPWILLLLPLALPFLGAYRLYDNDRRRITVSSIGEMPAAFHALLLYVFFVLVVLASTGAHSSALAVSELIIFLPVALTTISVARALLRRYGLSRAVTRQRTLIVGAGRVGQDIARRLTSQEDLNIEVVGFLDNDPKPMAEELAGLRVLGPEADIVRIAEQNQVERIILSFSRTPHEDLLEILRRSGLDRLYVSVVPRFFEIMASNVEIDDVAGVTVLDLQPARLSRGAIVAKRVFDVAMAVLAAPAILVSFAAIAIAIRIDSPGPIFFRQARMGRGGHVFRIFKFRTMVQGAEELQTDLLHMNEVTGPLFKLREDPRVTRVGRFLRQTSLDELPQLINVLRGEMSLVGPRPFVVHEADEFRGWARRRLELTPGMTGAWQVMGRNDMTFDEMVKLEYLYVTNWSLGGDLRLLLRTPASVLRRRGAY